MTTREEFIVLVSNDCVEVSDVIVLLEGDGVTRINKACDLVKEGLAPLLVFSGGIENITHGSYPYSVCLPLMKEEGISENQILAELNSQNTQEQAVEIIQYCIDRDWTKLILVATHYHQFRAFLTFLKVLESKGLESSIKIFNAPAFGDWFSENDWGSRYELLKSEFDKIEQYKNLGHISEYEYAISYIKNR
jgi:uncharacterized SAM-binding protein YcdF (DUF218 family)